jgi:hypothetical protein
MKCTHCNGSDFDTASSPSTGRATCRGCGSSAEFPPIGDNLTATEQTELKYSNHTPGHIYKVWLHIEELDEHGDPEDDEPTPPKQYGEFDTLPAAQEAVDLILSGHDYRPRPSAPDKNGEHTPGPWTIPGSANLVGTKNPRRLIAETHGENSTANARLIASAPALLASVEELRDCLAAWVDIADAEDLREYDFEALQNATAALAKAKGN